MKKVTSFVATLMLSSFFLNAVHAQITDTTFKPSGKFSMQLFADYDYFLNADTAGATSKIPSGKTYYAPIDPTNTVGGQQNINQRYYQAFDLRRLYLGYDYQMSKNVAAQVLFSHENGYLVNNSALLTTSSSLTTTTDTVTKDIKSVTLTQKSVALPTTASGDIVLDGNRGVYLKAANVQFKNWWMNSNVIFGQQSTPAFGVSENLFGYRSIEKSVADLRGLAQSNDLGIQAKGTFDEPGMYNYAVMISNGNGAKAENDKYKKLSVEANGWFMDKQIVVEAYFDMIDKAVGKTVITSTTAATDTMKGVDQSNTTLKVLAGYTSDPITVGVEYVMQTQKGQSVIVAGNDAIAIGLSIFARGTIMPKQLMWFARYDMFDPDTKATGANVDNTLAASWKENFITAGLDWQPDASANAHIMPNVWIDSYKDKSSAALDREGIFVGRVTFMYKF